jgi:predicted GIY-YIG superfamily endonuclease
VTVKTATTTTPRQRKPRQVEPSQLKPRQPKARWLVYLLRCRDGSLYTGITNDLPRRLKTHAAGKASRYTRSRLPLKLAYTEPQPSKSWALKREAAIKKLSRRQKDDLIGRAPTP